MMLHSATMSDALKHHRAVIAPFLLASRGSKECAPSALRSIQSNSARCSSLKMWSAFKGRILALQHLIAARSRETLQTLRPQASKADHALPLLSRRASSVRLADCKLFATSLSDHALAGSDVKDAPSCNVFAPSMGEQRPSPHSMNALTTLRRRFALQATGAPWSRPCGVRAIATRRLKADTASLHGSEECNQLQGCADPTNKTSRISDFLGHSTAVNRVYCDIAAPHAENASVTMGDLMNRSHMGGHLLVDFQRDIKKEIVSLDTQTGFNLFPLVDLLRAPLGSALLRRPSLLASVKGEKQWLPMLDSVRGLHALAQLEHDDWHPIPGALSCNGRSASVERAWEAFRGIRRHSRMMDQAASSSSSSLLSPSSSSSSPSSSSSTSSSASSSSSSSSTSASPPQSQPQPQPERECAWGSLDCSLKFKDACDMAPTAHAAAACIHLAHLYRSLKAACASEEAASQFRSHLLSLRESGAALMRQRMGIDAIPKDCPDPSSFALRSGSDDRQQGQEEGFKMIDGGRLPRPPGERRLLTDAKLDHEKLEADDCLKASLRVLGFSLQKDDLLIAKTPSCSTKKPGCIASLRSAIRALLAADQTLADASWSPSSASTALAALVDQGGATSDTAGATQDSNIASPGAAASATRAFADLCNAVLRGGGGAAAEEDSAIFAKQLSSRSQLHRPDLLHIIMQKREALINAANALLAHKADMRAAGIQRALMQQLSEETQDMNAFGARLSKACAKRIAAAIASPASLATIEKARCISLADLRLKMHCPLDIRPIADLAIGAAYGVELYSESLADCLSFAGESAPKGPSIIAQRALEVASRKSKLLRYYLSEPL